MSVMVTFVGSTFAAAAIARIRSVWAALSKAASVRVNSSDTLTMIVGVGVVSGAGVVVVVEIGKGRRRQCWSSWSRVPEHGVLRL